mgnify:CR=1 FL=1
MKLSKTLLFAFATILPVSAASAQGCPGSVRFGTACNGFALSCQNGSWAIGQTANVFAALGPTRAPAIFTLGAGAPTTLDLTSAGAPGCFLYSTPLVTIPTTLIGDGHADMAFKVPNDPSLRGKRMTLQAAVVDPRANALGISTSNALAVTIP